MSVAVDMPVPSPAGSLPSHVPLHLIPAAEAGIPALPIADIPAGYFTRDGCPEFVIDPDFRPEHCMGNAEEAFPYPESHMMDLGKSNRRKRMGLCAGLLGYGVLCLLLGIAVGGLGVALPLALGVSGDDDDVQSRPGQPAAAVEMYQPNGCPTAASGLVNLTSAYVPECTPMQWGDLLTAAANRTAAGGSGRASARQAGCPLLPATEYFHDGEQQNTIDVTVIMAERMFHVAQYKPSCPSLAACCSDEYNAVNASACSAIPAQDVQEPFNTYTYNTPSVAQWWNKPSFGQPAKTVPRQAHGKTTSCMAASFQVEQDLPERLAVGLFRPGATHDAVVRFSGHFNVTSKDLHDGRLRALSIKLLDVLLPLIQLPDVPYVGLTPSGKQYFGERLPEVNEAGVMDLTAVAVRGVDATHPRALNLFPAPNGIKFRNGFLNGAPPAVPIENLTAVTFNPLRLTYGSAAPYRMGPHAAVKFHFAACPGELENIGADLPVDLSDADFQASNLQASMEKVETFSLCMYMREQENPCTEPIEDQTVIWSTPDILVGRLVFKGGPGALSAPRNGEACEGMVFNPYRTAAEHFPLGSINRLRLPTYSYAALIRNQINGNTPPNTRTFFNSLKALNP